MGNFPFFFSLQTTHDTLKHVSGVRKAQHKICVSIITTTTIIITTIVIVGIIVVIIYSVIFIMTIIIIIDTAYHKHCIKGCRNDDSSV